MSDPSVRFVEQKTTARLSRVVKLKVDDKPFFIQYDYDFERGEWRYETTTYTHYVRPGLIDQLIEEHKPQGNRVTIEGIKLG